MSTEHEPLGTPGLYHEELPRFDGRQAWSGQLGAGPGGQFMNVGHNEHLHFPANREASPISRREAEMSLIRQIISEGTARVTQLKPTREALSNLGIALDNLTPPSNHLNDVYEVIRQVLSAEEIMRGNEIIARAAGYIAARNSLWIVTKSVPVEAGHRRPRHVAVARLRGLTFSDTKNGRPVLPVVSGKNDKLGKLDKVTRDHDRRVVPHVLDILEGTKTR